MRVLLVITRGERGGAQAHVLELVQGLRDRIEFTVALGQGDFLPEALQTLGVSVRTLPDLRREVAPAADLRACHQLRRLIRTLRPDLVHTHSSKAGVVGRAAAWREGIPAVHTAHAWSFSDGLPLHRVALSVPIELLAGRATRRFITVSQADRRIALRYHVARHDQVRVVYNGITDTPWRAEPDAPGVPTIAMVARLAPPKDHLSLLRALAGVRAPFRLLLVGDGPHRGAIEAALRTHGFAERTVLAGDSAAVPHLLAGAQIGALVSRQEGFPIAVLEYMRAGLPVVASDVGGVREAVENESTGMLVSRGDVTGLRSALTRLLTDAHLRRTLGSAGRRTWEQRFTTAHLITGTEGAYRELADEGGWPRPLHGSTPPLPGGGGP